jgi:hypothetical protein
MRCTGDADPGALVMENQPRRPGERCRYVASHVKRSPSMPWSFLRHPLTKLAAVIASRAAAFLVVLFLLWAQFFWFNAGVRTPVGFIRVTTYKGLSILRYWEPSISSPSHNFTSGSQPRERFDATYEVAQLPQRHEASFKVPGFQVWTRKPNDLTGTNRNVVVVSHLFLCVSTLVSVCSLHAFVVRGREQPAT